MKNINKRKSAFQKQQAAQKRAVELEQRAARKHQIYRDMLGGISLLAIIFVVVSALVPPVRTALQGVIPKVGILLLLVFLVAVTIIVALKIPPRADVGKQFLIPRRYGIGSTINPRNPWGLLIYGVIAILLIYTIFAP
ncbi:MAG: hypothetical protein LKF36_08880 [Lactobacillus sp.]|jgi:uncharacterized membrane protein|nr:hypothetical protein [Lactobacillus sp.]